MQRLIQASQGSCGWAKLLAAGMFEEVGGDFETPLRRGFLAGSV